MASGSPFKALEQCLTGYPDRLSFTDILGHYPHWEGITTLFHFRNVLAHGRQVSAVRTLIGQVSNEDGTIQDRFSDEFGGSYRKVEDYLRKQKLISASFVDAQVPNSTAQSYFPNMTGFGRY
jgi:hypothetical protein